MDNSISVIIPVYNGELYLAETIESVLAQSHAPCEILVVDDGSTDSSAHIAQNYGGIVRYLSQDNAGAAAARNHGVDKARGTHLAFLDADDLWVPSKLEIQMQALKANPKLEMVFGQMHQFVSSELSANLKNSIRCPAEPMPGLTHCAMLIKSAAFHRVGHFQTNWQLGEFIDWYLKATENGLVGSMLPEVVIKRRLHAGNQGRHNHDFRQDYVRIIKASLDRRRQK